MPATSNIINVGNFAIFKLQREIAGTREVVDNAKAELRARGVSEAEIEEILRDDFYEDDDFEDSEV